MPCLIAQDFRALAPKWGFAPGSGCVRFLQESVARPSHPAKEEEEPVWYDEVTRSSRPTPRKARPSRAAGLGDNELLAVILGHGFWASSAINVANDVVRGVHGLTRQSQGELRRLKGIGAVKASQILAAVELGRRTLLRAPERREQLGSPRDVASYLLPRYGARAVEQFGIVLLDTKHRVLKTTVLSVGILDASVVHVREVFREAAGGGAAAIVLFHNHPSGDPTPSGEDAALTARLVEAGRVMGIDVVDHLILADARYCSFKEMGRL